MKGVASPFDAILAGIRAHPDSLLSDHVLAFAVALDEVGFERLRKKLSDEYAETKDLQAFVRAVKARRKSDREARRGQQHAHLDERPQIVITVDEGGVNEQAAAALGKIPGVYSRMGELVRVVPSRRRRPGEAHPDVVPTVRVVTEPLLREMFSRAARWVEPKEDPNGGPTLAVAAHPPEWSVRAVKAWHDWPEVAPLYHVSDAPVVLPDGRVISERGYDAATGILCETRIDVYVPDAPTQGDARAAAAHLLELVSQVPFEDEAHRSAWLASLLTPIARWAFRGQAPLFMFDANREGSGKGFLVGINAGIAMGRDCDKTTQTADEESEHKFITSKVLTGQPIVFIDECDKPFGSGAIQGVLTSGTWAPRLLGTNDSPSYPAYIVWYAAGNNVQLKSGDIARRVCFVRIVTDLDNPAERSGFKIDDMDSYIPAHRAELFGAALTMIRAWLLSGRTVESLGDAWGGRWGGFNDWDRVVRGAIVFAGFADPIAAKATRVTPTIHEGASDLVLGLEQAIVDMGEREVRVSDLHTALAENDTARKEAHGYAGSALPTLRFVPLRKGFASLMPRLKGATPTASEIAFLLSRFKAQAVPDPATPAPHVRKWIKHRHSDGGLWRVDALVSHVERDEAERAAIEAPLTDDTTGTLAFGGL